MTFALGTKPFDTTTLPRQLPGREEIARVVQNFERLINNPDLNLRVELSKTSITSVSDVGLRHLYSVVVTSSVTTPIWPPTGRGAA